MILCKNRYPVGTSVYWRPKWITSTKSKFAVRKHFARTVDTSGVQPVVSCRLFVVAAVLIGCWESWIPYEIILLALIGSEQEPNIPHDYLLILTSNAKAHKNYSRASELREITDILIKRLLRLTHWSAERCGKERAMHVSKVLCVRSQSYAAVLPVGALTGVSAATQWFVSQKTWK